MDDQQHATRARALAVNQLDGYARVSTPRSSTACLRHLRAGDTLAVWRLDRLGRSLKHLIELIASLEQRQIAFRSLRENIDTTTPAGRLQLHLFGALAEFERELIRERTRAGLEAPARAAAAAGAPPKSPPTSSPPRPRCATTPT